MAKLNDTIISGNLYVSGQITCRTCTATSDMNLKTNIEPFVNENSILKLPVYKYDFIDGETNQIGCLAQDLQELYPELVVENDDGYLSIQETKLVYLLLDEVKKLREELDEFKTRYH